MIHRHWSWQNCLMASRVMQNTECPSIDIPMVLTWDNDRFLFLLPLGLSPVPEDTRHLWAGRQRTFCSWWSWGPPPFSYCGLQRAGRRPAACSGPHRHHSSGAGRRLWHGPPSPQSEARCSFRENRTRTIQWQRLLILWLFYSFVSLLNCLRYY